MSRYITKHHDPGQPYVSFAGPDTINHGSHSSGVNDQLRKLGEERQSIVTVKQEIIFQSTFSLARFLNLGPKNQVVKSEISFSEIVVFIKEFVSRIILLFPMRRRTPCEETLCGSVFRASIAQLLSLLQSMSKFLT